MVLNDMAVMDVSRRLVGGGDEMGYGSMTKVDQGGRRRGDLAERSLLRSPSTQPKVGFVTAILTVS